MKTIKLIPLGILVFIFAIFIVEGAAQPYFSRTYDIDPSGERGNDQGVVYYAAAENGTYFHSVKFSRQGSYFVVSYFHENQEMAWQKGFQGEPYGFDIFGYRQPIINTPTGPVFLGNLLSPVGTMYQLVFLDPEGEEIKRYTYTYDFPYIRVPSSIAYGKNGYIYLVGTMYLDTVTTQGGERTFLSVIDPETGEEISFRNYNPRDFSYEIVPRPYSIVCLQNGDVVIAFRQEAPGAVGWILVSDALGNERWKKPIGDYIRGGFYPKPSIAVDEKRGRIYAMWLTDTGSDAMSDENTFFYNGRLYSYRLHPYTIFAFDMDGNPLWNRMVRTPFPNDYEVFDLTVAENGDVLFCGYDQGYNTVDLDEHGRSYGSVVRLDNSGELVWERYIDDKRHDPEIEWSKIDRQFKTVQELENGDILLSGDKVDTIGGGIENYRNTNLWLVRLDSLGNCYGDDCPILHEDNLPVKTTFARLKQMKIFPNPARDYLQIEYENLVDGTVMIIDNLGRELFVRDLEGVRELRLKVKDLTPGIYTVLTRDRTGILHSTRRLAIQ